MEGTLPQDHELSPAASPHLPASAQLGLRHSSVPDPFRCPLGPRPVPHSGLTPPRLSARSQLLPSLSQGPGPSQHHPQCSTRISDSNPLRSQPQSWCLCPLSAPPHRALSPCRLQPQPPSVPVSPSLGSDPSSCAPFTPTLVLRLSPTLQQFLAPRQRPPSGSSSPLQRCRCPPRPRPSGPRLFYPPTPHPCPLLPRQCPAPTPAPIFTPAPTPMPPATPAAIPTSAPIPASFSLSRVCFPAAQAPAMQVLPVLSAPGTVLTPSQPLVYILPPSCGQPPAWLHCQPPWESPSTHAPCPAILLAGQVSSRGASLPELRSYPYAFPVARPLTSESKLVSLEVNRLPCALPIGAAPAPSLHPMGSLGLWQTHPCLLLLPRCFHRHSLCCQPQRELSPTASHQDARQCGAANRRDFRSPLSPLKSPPQLEREMASPP